MVRVLCVWEQGTNLGHLSHLRTPLQAAQALGHNLALAARELHRIPQVLPGLRLDLWQAPFKQNVPSVSVDAVQCYAQLLATQCFSSSQELGLYVRAWRSIFDAFSPDIVFFEHSPTALVAAWTYGFHKVVIGSGFTVPRTDGDVSLLQPFPTASTAADAVAQYVQHERQLLALINQVHAEHEAPVMESLAALYTQAPVHALMTVPAADCFGPRPLGHYLGVGRLGISAAPVWPAGSGPRVFGYLVNFPGLPQLLLALELAEVRGLLLVRDIPDALRARFAGRHLTFLDHLLDLEQVAAQADWVVHHGNHATSAEFSFAGVPQLAIPLHQEHLFCALRLVEQSCGLAAYQDQASFVAAVQAMGERADLRVGARAVQANSVAYDSVGVDGFFRSLLQDI
jgi:hypothetical protein